ncbi:Virilizer N-terminal [Trinorchestia longiramus]|nr:Virilizer N-terminal [Trinorchestia longiramus]
MSSLVFFDTFSHESSDVPKLDLVQFPKAVHVSEVRVIPLGARVKADFPGGVRLGATNPSQFIIDFFVNDCGKRGATTFENVGQLQYNQQGPIKLDFDKTPPTDGLLLRGSYNTITLAVYGTLSRATREPPPKSPPPPPPPVPVSPPPVLPSVRHPARPPTSPCSPGKHEVAVTSPPLPHPLPEKVNPNERIRDWLQDTQVPQSPLDLDQSPTKDAWEDPSLDGDQCKEELSPAPPPPSPPSHPSQPHSPPHSPSPERPSRSRVSSSERSQRRRDHSPRERSHDRGHERSIEIYDRTVDRSHDCSLDRSIERSHDRLPDRSHNKSRDRSDRDGDRVGRSGRERHRRTSREHSRELSERRSLSLARSQVVEGREGCEGTPRDGGRTRDKKEKRTKDSKRSKEEKRDKRKLHDDWVDGSASSHRRLHHRRYSSDSLQEAGPRTPPPPPLPLSSPHWTDKDAEDKRDCEAPNKRPKLDSETELVPSTGMLFPEDDMEAISDDEDLPDLPLEDTDAPPAGAADGVGQTSGDVLSASAVPSQAEVGTDGPGSAVMPTTTLDFEEIMSDEEELPEYQEFEEESAEEEYIVEEWEEWQKPYSVLEEFQFVAPLVHLCSPALTSHQAAIVSALSNGPAADAANVNGCVGVGTTSSALHNNGTGATTSESSASNPVIVAGGSNSAHVTGTTAPVAESLADVKDRQDESISKLVATVADGCVPRLGSTDEERESFVYSCEQVTNLLPSTLHLLTHDKIAECVWTLCGWVAAGLDVDCAMAQLQPVFKIRHLKAGIRLCTVLCQCSDSVTRLLLNQLPLLHALRALYHEPHMALSIRLLIIRCMDSVLSSCAGVQLFMSLQPKLDLTGYEVLLQLIAATSNTRAKVALAAVLRKLHLLEVLEKLRDDVTAVHALLPLPSVPPQDTGEGPPADCHFSKLPSGETKAGPASAVLPIDTPLGGETCEREDEWCGGPGEGMDIDEGTSSRDEDVREESDEDDLPPCTVVTVPHPIVASLTSCLQHVLHTFTHAERLLAQPIRYLPVGKQFQVPRCQYDVLQEVFVLLDYGGLMASLSRLCSALAFDLQLCPPSAEGGSSRCVMFALVCRLLTRLLHAPHGLTYLAAHSVSSTTVVRSLLKMSDNENVSIVPSYLRDTLQEEKLEESPMDPQELGILIVEQLYVLHQLDSLAHINARANLSDVQHNDPQSIFNDSLQSDIQKTSSDEHVTSFCSVRSSYGNIDLQQSVVHLNSLAGVMHTHRSKMSLVKTLATGSYVEHLLPYLTLLSPKDTVETAPLKAACFGYAAELLSTTVKINSDASFLERHAEKMCQIIEAVDAREGPVMEEVAKLTELLPWLSVARKPESFSYDNIPHLVEIFKSRLEQVDKFPGELFTVLRIMENLALPPYPIVESQDSEEVIQELKYQYSIVQFFSADLTTHLNTFLTKLSSLYPQPGLHAAQLSGAEGGLLVSLLQPALILLHALLKQVIRVRGAAYHDMSSVQPLLSTYLLVTSIPKSCPYGEASCSLQQLVLRSLLLYTQPGHNPSTPCDANGLWPQMLLQVLKFCGRAPHTMVAGLCLLAELLPLPLPISGRQLTAGEQERYIVVRKLWATNIAPLAEEIHKLIFNLAVGSHASLAYALRRACVALADLAPQTVLIVVRPLLDLTMQHLKQDPASTNNYRELARVLYTLASLSSHAGIKAAVLHQLMTESYVTLLPLWTSVAAEEDIRRPLCLAFLHLCRAHNNLLGGVEGVQWGVPCRELLAPLLECQVCVLAQDWVPHSTLQPLLLSLTDVCCHDFGLYHLKSALDKRRGCFLPVLNTLVADIPNSGDALDTLQIFFDFISALLNSDAPVLTDYAPSPPSSRTEGGVSVFRLRTMCVTAIELCYYVSWQTNKDMKVKNASNTYLKSVTTAVGGDVNASSEDSKSVLQETRGMPDAVDVITVPEVVAVDSAGGNSAVVYDESSSSKPAGSSELPAAAAAAAVQHPLRRLEPLVIDCEGQESLLERLYSNITELTAFLDNCDAAEAVIRVSEVSEEDGGWVGTGGRSIAQQYEQRLVCCPLSPQYESPKLWLQPPPSLYSPEGELDNEMISVSLAAVLHECRVTDYDLDVSVQKVLRGHQGGVSPQKGPLLVKGPAKLKGNSLPSRGTPGRGIRPYGFPGRGMNLRSDHFRCRPPNTSRPPSLHVDDFVALESTGHQPTGPTGYNRISFGRGKMLLDCVRGRGNRGMNRGDNRGGLMPGRFMYRPMYRPDFNSRGMMNRGMRWNFRGGDGMIRSGGPLQMNSQYRQQGPGGMRFMRGRGFLSRGAPGGYGDRGGRHMRGQFH